MMSVAISPGLAQVRMDSFARAKSRRNGQSFIFAVIAPTPQPAQRASTDVGIPADDPPPPNYPGEARDQIGSFARPDRRVA